MPSELRCAQCNQRFANVSSLQRHMETHMITGDWLCALCNTLVNRYSALTIHWRNSCVELKEVFCDDELKLMSTEDLREIAFRYTIDRYTMEQEQEHDDELLNIKNPSSICSFCHLHVPRGCLTYHLRTHTLRRAVGQKMRNSMISYLCDLCGFGFRYKKSLIKHWREKCSELRAYFKEPVEVNNRYLKEIVVSILKQAEIFTPIPISDHEFSKDEDSEEEEGAESESDSQAETESQLIIPAQNSNRALWNLDRNQKKPSCPECFIDFFSQGRLNNHQKSCHPSQKPIFNCELCQTKFKHQRALQKHLRESCRAMKVEEPDGKKRKAMSKEELMEVLEKRKTHWKAFFEKKKQANLQFITEFLSDLDRQRAADEPVQTVFLEPLRASVDSEQLDGQRSCQICNINFHDNRFLQQHIQTVHHHATTKCTRNQITVTTSSLISHFKMSSAIFYDSDGNEHKMGKFVEPSDSTKSKVMKSGERIEQVKGNVLVEVGDGAFVMLNEHEIAKISDPDGKLKMLYAEDPRAFDDIPTLERQDL